MIDNNTCMPTTDYSQVIEQLIREDVEMKRIETKRLHKLHDG